MDKLEKEFPQSKKKKKPLKNGIISYHIVKFVQAAMNILDKH